MKRKYIWIATVCPPGCTPEDRVTKYFGTRNEAMQLISYVNSVFDSGFHTLNLCITTES